MPRTFSIRASALDRRLRSARHVLARLAVIITTLSLVGSTAAAISPAQAAAVASTQALARDATTATSERRRFESAAAYYAAVTSPAESLSFEWDSDTGVPTRFDWLHGGVLWYLNGSTPGHITRESPNVNYYDVDIRVGPAGFEHAPRTIKGKLTVNAERPNGATFAAILEGSGSRWFVADGTLTAP